MTAEANHAGKEGCNMLLILYSLLSFPKERKLGFLYCHVPSSST
jgi:hypothetical protein